MKAPFLKLMRRPPADALPTFEPIAHRGQVRVLTGDDATTADKLYFGRDNAGTGEWTELTDQPGAGTTVVVQEGDSDVVTALTTLDFDASDFNITESPAGEGNVALAYGTSAGTPAEGNHTHTLFTLTVEEGDSSVDTAVTHIDFDASDFNVTSSPAGEANVALAYGTSAGTPAEGNHTHTASVISGGVIFGGWISQNNYSLYQFVAGAGVSAAASALTADTMVAGLFPVPVATTFDQISINVNTLVALSTIRLGVYAVGTDSLPGARIADWGTVSSATTGTKTLSISWAPVAGWYYIVMSCSAGAAVNRFGGGMGVAPFGNPVGSITITGVTDWTLAAPGSSAALPNPFGASPGAVGTHRPTWLRVA
jgi:hypothetical protein